MEQKTPFYKLVINIALPITLQWLLQSSFSVVDQIMTGQLGSGSIAGIGLGGKFSSIYSVLVSAIAAVAGIMIAQYMGQKDGKEVGRSFFVNLSLAVFLAAAFTGICFAFSGQIMNIYTKDAVTREIAAGYLRIIAISFIPMAVSMLFSTLLRCMEAASLPLYASIFAAVVNTGLNY
ncbi:MAG: MATE family efflux transporter, partial [Clostridium sp.]|nr:MATE family efflux transporter [Clostridium sp.]